MKMYNHISKVVTDYPNCKLTKKQRIVKKRLQIAVEAWNKMLALRTFKQSSIFSMAIVNKV